MTANGAAVDVTVEVFIAMACALPATAFVIDGDGVYRWVNDEYLRAHGFRRYDVVGRHRDLVLPPEQAAGFAAVDEQVLAEGRTVRVPWFRYARADGRAGWASGVQLRLRSASGWCVGGVYLDHDEGTELGKRLHRVLEQTPIFVATTGTDLRYTYAVGAGLADLGFTVAVDGPGASSGPKPTIYDIVGSTDHSHPAIAPLVAALEGRSSSYRLHFGKRALACQIGPLRDDNGTVVGTLAVVLDITDQHLAEARAQAFMENSPALVDIRDADGRYVYFNSTAAHLFGATAECMLGRTIHEVTPSSVADRIVAIDRRALETGRPIRWTETLSTTDGTPLRATGYRFPLPMPDGSTGLGTISLDITELDSVRRAAAQARHHYQTLVDHASIPIIALDRRGRVTEANPAALALLDHSLAGVRGTWWGCHVATNTWPSHKRNLHELAAGRRTRVDLTVILVTRNGDHLPATATLTRLREQDGPAASVLALLTPHADRPRPPDRPTPLTSGEHRVLIALAGGRTLPQIADELDITTRGIDYRLSRIRHKLRDPTGDPPATTAAVIARAYATGLLIPHVWPPR